MTVEEMLSRISSRELTGWRAYWSIVNSEMEQMRGGGASRADFVKIQTMNRGSVTVET